MTKDLTVKDEINNQLINIFGSSDFPVSIQSGINDIMTLVNNNTSLPELYDKELKETMVSTSIFQDICVQMEEHYTPHRKIRQLMLELSGNLDALDSAKNSHKKSIVKCQLLEKEINELEDLYNIIDTNNEIDLSIALRLSNIKYTIKSGADNITSYEIIGSNILDILSNGKIEVVNDSKFIDIIKSKIKVALGNKIIDYEEAERGLKSSQHLVKDSAIKAYQLRKQVEVYTKEVDESGLSFDESEFIYYVMYFTAEAERQLRTGDHQVDRGTYKAISQLPDFIRLKVLKNIDYIKRKLVSNNYDISMDYIFKTDEEILHPHIERDTDGILVVEGVKVDDYLLMEPVRIVDHEQEEEA